MDLKLWIMEFIKLICEISVLFIFVSFLMGILQDRYAPLLQKYLASNSIWVYWRGIFLGAITPFCSCSTIPIFRSLLQNRCHFGASMGYLLTSPLLNPILLTLLISALGWKIAVFYIFFIVVSIFIIALFLHRFDLRVFLSKGFLQSLQAIHYPSQDFSPSHLMRSNPFSKTSQIPKIRSFQSFPLPKAKTNLKALMIKSLLDYKKIFPYIAFAMALGAGVHHFLPKEFLQNYMGGSLFELVILAFIGVFLYIKIELALPLGLVLLQSGMPIGSMMCLLIAGSGASLPEMILLKSMFRWRFLVVFMGIVMGIAVGFGLVLNHSAFALKGIDFAF